MSEEISAAESIVGDAWRRSDVLFGMLGREAWRSRAIPLRHPPIFYLGHLAAFAWNHVGVGVLGLEAHDPSLDALFERGIDPLSEAAAEDATISEWPALAEIRAYRDAVRERLAGIDEALAAKADEDVLAEGGRVWWLVREHEEMHHETLLYLFHALPTRQLRRPSGWPRLRVGPEVRAPRWAPVRSGPAVLGTALEEVTFAWDNECPQTTVHVDAFLLQDLPVTVARYRAFVDAGGYSNDALWDEADLAWRKDKALAHPASWRPAGDGFEVRSTFAWLPLEDVGGWPVQVSLAEARAFAKWSDARLPTEAELNRAAFMSRSDAVQRWPWGDDDPAEHANLDLQTGGLEPVLSRRSGQGPWGHHELVGNCWEWTSTPFRPLPGFEPWHHTYPGYSQDFFDEAHYVVFGASWATARGLARRSFRNWYQPHYPYVFAGFRLAR